MSELPHIDFCRCCAAARSALAAKEREVEGLQRVIRSDDEVMGLLVQQIDDLHKQLNSRSTVPVRSGAIDAPAPYPAEGGSSK